jgi:hypothetical protein
MLRVKSQPVAPRTLEIVWSRSSETPKRDVAHQKHGAVTANMSVVVGSTKMLVDSFPV